MSGLKQVQDEQFKMLTIMLEQEHKNKQVCPLPPMECYGGPAEKEKPRTPSPTPPPTPPKTPSPAREPSPPSTPKQRTPSPIRPKTPEPEVVVKDDRNCGECMVLKRKEIDFELEQLRRETQFRAIDLDKIWSCDHEDANFENHLAKAIDEIQDDAELAKFEAL